MNYPLLESMTRNDETVRYLESIKVSRRPRVWFKIEVNLESLSEVPWRSCGLVSWLAVTGARVAPRSPAGKEVGCPTLNALSVVSIRLPVPFRTLIDVLHCSDAGYGCFCLHVMRVSRTYLRLVTRCFQLGLLSYYVQYKPVLPCFFLSI